MATTEAIAPALARTRPAAGLWRDAFGRLRKNKLAMVRLLLELGADAAAKDSRGYTPLNLATRNTDPAIVTALVAAGANPK